MSTVADVQMLCNDTGVYFPLPQIYDAINEVQLIALQDTKWKRISTLLPLNSGMDLVTIPQDIFIPQWFEWTDPTHASPTLRWFPTTHVELQRYNQLWRGDGLDRTRFFVLWDAEHFRCYPRPDQVYDFTLWGIGWPSEINDTNQTVEGSKYLQRSVALQSAAQLHEFTRPDIADAYSAEAEMLMQKFRKQLRNQQSHNIRIIRPGTVFTRAQAGQIPAGYLTGTNVEAPITSTQGGY